MRAMLLTLATLIATAVSSYAHSGGTSTYEWEPLAEGARVLRIEVRSQVVLRPKFTGIAKITGAGIRWVLPEDGYYIKGVVHFEGRRYYALGYVAKSYDGRTMPTRRGSNSFGCESTFQEYVLFDSDTGALAPRAWKSMTHKCDGKLKRQGEWTDEFDIESPGAIRVGDISDSAGPAVIERQ